MTIIKSDIDAFIARPDPARAVALIYGADAGLVRERVDRLLAASVDTPDDPFSLVRLTSDDLGADPGRLADEANTVPMFGGRRAVLLKVTSRHNIIPSVEAVLASPPPGCRVVIEAGELRKNAPLRVLCEKSKAAAAVPCYVDNAQALSRLIDEEMAAAALTLASDARAALIALLGGDRLASRSEIRKLALYAHGKGRVDLADVRAVASDASDLGLDALIDAAFAGRVTEVEREFGKARSAGSSPGAVILAALRQVAHLHRMRLALDQSGDIKGVMMRVPPPVHFSREQIVAAALNAWTAPRLLTAMEQLAEASFETRRQPALATAIAQRALLNIATSARRREAA
jgi:DNA polymerase-3 subunit delta